MHSVVSLQVQKCVMLPSSDQQQSSVYLGGSAGVKGGLEGGALWGDQQNIEKRAVINAGLAIAGNGAASLRHAVQHSVLDLLLDG